MCQGGEKKTQREKGRKTRSAGRRGSGGKKQPEKDETPDQSQVKEPLGWKKRWWGGGERNKKGGGALEKGTAPWGVNLDVKIWGKWQRTNHKFVTSRKRSLWKVSVFS